LSAGLCLQTMSPILKGFSAFTSLTSFASNISAIAAYGSVNIPPLAPPSSILN